MTSLARNAGQSGALFDLAGTVATNATWAEDIYFTEAGAAFDLTDLDFKMTFRCSPENTSADFTLSTDDGTLSIVEDADSGVDRVLRITVTAGDLSALDGDYIADLASRDVAGVVILWAHGIVSFRPNPVTF
jgi:hypothetical protein